MEKKARRSWSAEARARHREGVTRYQKERELMYHAKLLFDAAQAINVDPKSLARTITAADRVTLWTAARIKPMEERFKAFRELVFATCKETMSFRAWAGKVMA